ncbi:flagellar biosynthesis anti-sigma factor FlgM [Enterobacteriaceae bacterium H20N1]|uniref:Negative regulator of flagellin synthesis n=1 Tax=Dryocola boscaweniae TaxID=2925397 RepID=A0A9X2W6L9_9ENTR|nr:flagellar biosynthesis anti-sigma factor FlgM [Dryocola boscaweniae]MCT4701566.1 flagellar biosynthesis anti-sigma factor FlgM [Dryocola boscaweniae]MCT4716208.1 flagellar biosynthesis anti-sigma factor FlgM [Dryocola boscaweniae]MCT4718735.1 flagellar biosynthesis anti-sigma factor FlgM [Dryocola boscaweniae]
MKITPTHYNVATAINQTSAAEQTRTQAAEGLNIERSRAIDPVLGDAQTQIAALPEVDMEKVAAMKEAISAGKINVNLDELTGAMQKYYQR